MYKTSKAANGLRKICVLAGIALLFSNSVSGQEDKEKLDQIFTEATETLREIMAVPDKSIPKSVRETASCVIVIPKLRKSSFLAIEHYGPGVGICRAENGWSAPAFVQMSGGSLGLQVGSQTTDLVLITTKENVLQNILKEKYKMGADASASAGPVGREAEAGSDSQLHSELLSYSHSKGVFAGINLYGSVLSANDDSNHAYYGQSRTSSELLTGRDTSVSGYAKEFTQTVSKYFSKGSGSVLSGGFSTLAPKKSPPPSYQVVRIFFATDRARGASSPDLETFTGERSKSEDLTLGNAEISIPRDHKMGELESPSLLRLEFREDPESHVVLLKAKRLSKDQFELAVNDRLKNDEKKQVLVFVHGYNVTFEDGARRLGQMVYDLGFAGAPILYSWPSHGTKRGYGEDEASIEWSAPHFISFLQSLHLDPDVKTIYLVGHSMGNRLVSAALKSLGPNPPTSPPMFREVIMAAPDIDEGVFGQFAEVSRKAASRITIYESSADKALMASHGFHGYARLGDTDPTVHVFSHYECIEASAVDTSFLGHSYVGDSNSILGDMFDLLTKDVPAGQRFRLVEHKVDGLPYWVFKK